MNRIKDIIENISQSEMIVRLKELNHRIYRRIHGHRKNGVGYIKRNGSYEAVIFKNGVVVSTFDEAFEKISQSIDLEMIEAERKDSLSNTVFKIEVSAYINYKKRYSIEVKDTPRNNLILSNGEFWQKKTRTLRKKHVVEIKNIIRDSNVFEIGEIEFAYVCDGFADNIFFSVDGRDKEIRTDNLDYHRRSGNAPNARNLLSIISRIYMILRDYGVDDKYFFL